MSTRKFEIGDRVRVNSPGAIYHDCEGMVTSALMFAPLYSNRLGASRETWFYCTDIPPKTKGLSRTGFEPHELEPIYDGNQAASWSECCWQPRALKV